MDLVDDPVIEPTVIYAYEHEVELGRAWALAEAVLPEGWEHMAVRRERHFGTNDWGYVAEAGKFADMVDGESGWSGPQPSPAAALRVLAQKLRGVDGPR